MSISALSSDPNLDIYEPLGRGDYLPLLLYMGWVGALKLGCHVVQVYTQEYTISSKLSLSL